MRYKSRWEHAIPEVIQNTTFDNSLIITENNDIISVDEFDNVVMYMGHLLHEPSITASGVGCTSASTGRWSFKFNIDQTLNNFQYAYYSVLAKTGEDKYEVDNGIVYVKTVIGGDL